MDEIEDLEESKINIDDKFVKSALVQYITEAKKFPILAREEEKNIAISALSGDKRARDRLIQSNLLLVVKIAHEYNSIFNNLNDLVQEGNIGLLRSVGKYDPNRGYRFSTYAGWWVRSMILRYIFNNSHMIKPGTTNEQKKLFYNLRKEQKRLEILGVDADSATIAQNLDVSEEDVVEMDARLHNDISLDAPSSFDDGTETKQTFADSIASPQETQPDNAIESHNFHGMLKEKLNIFAGRLKNDRQREIFYKRIVADEEDRVTLQSIADRFFVSKERVRQCEADILIKLKKYINKYI